MKIATENSFHLTYCTNIHPGEDWSSVFTNLKQYIPTLKENISPNNSFGICSFVNPQLKLPQAKVALTLLKKKLGFRYLMDVIPLDASLVKGSHGRVTTSPDESSLFSTSETHLLTQPKYRRTEVCGLILDHLKGR